MDQGCSLRLTIQPGDRPWYSGGGQGPRNRWASPPGPVPSPASAAALPGGLLQSSHLLRDTLLPSQQVASPPTRSKSPDGPAGHPHLSTPRSRSVLSPAWAPRLLEAACVLLNLSSLRTWLLRGPCRASQGALVSASRPSCGTVHDCAAPAWAAG